MPVARKTPVAFVGEHATTIIFYGKKHHGSIYSLPRGAVYAAVEMFLYTRDV